MNNLIRSAFAACAFLSLNVAAFVQNSTVTELQNEISNLKQSSQSRFAHYEHTNAQSRFPNVSRQFICPYGDGQKLYDLINTYNQKLNDINDLATQTQVVEQLRQFEREIMEISAWDLFLSANRNINASTTDLAGVLKHDKNYVPQWGAWLHDHKNNEQLIDKTTLQLTEQAIADNKWICEGDCLSNELDLELFSKESKVLGGGVLVDQAGNPVFYESRANGLLYQNLQEGNQYSVPMFFPLGQCTEFIDIGLQVDGVVGKKQNIEPVLTVKLAWKILTNKDDEDRYFTIDNVSVNMAGKAHKVTLGMVGMHVAIKEQRQVQWRWTTFEHIDNLYEPDQGSTKTPSFYNPKCTDCCENMLPADSTQPAQLTRIEPLQPSTISLNERVQKLLGKYDSKLQYYKLVETQYTSLVAPSITKFYLERTPNDARNAVLEPFVVPSKPSCNNISKYIVPIHYPTTGCMGCHKYAEYKSKSGKLLNADFTFIQPLNLTKETKK
ncbi:hypothetical protein L1286_12505 [Pseudoalteromonas sp. SMS1]|uniref:hypothetical protein n=1 Tax=Pseudoalteromonas sp. SMS1 TaxID=2908894 RepID=UPI001F3538F2|nr:hypothetical protein [Pseudoalteromonas sp. SMS1]MCF2858300.1 hypothetical protein [Pseudoalteromonas sp. SMS1]